MTNNFSPKQPSEEYYLGFNFTNDLAGEALVSAVVTYSPALETGSLIDDEKQELSGNTVLFWVQGGVHLTTYKITAVVTGSNDSVYEMDGTLTVREL